MSLEDIDFFTIRIVVFENRQDHVNVKASLNSVDVSWNEMFELTKFVFETSTLARIFCRLVMITLHVEIVNHLLLWVSTNFENVDIFHLFD